VCVYVKIFHFKKLLRSAGKTGVKEMKLKFSELREFVRPLQTALGVLPAALKVKPRANSCLPLSELLSCLCFLVMFPGFHSILPVIEWLSSDLT